MVHHFRPLLLVAAVAFLIGCGPPVPVSGSDGDTGSADVRLDVFDAGGDVDVAIDVSSDAGVDGSDSADGSGGRDGFGEISGTCGVLDDELDSPDPFLFRNAIDFGTDPYDDTDRDRLTAGSRTILDAGNENEGSILSEVFAYEVLARCEEASLLETETTIEYDVMGTRTDLLVEIDGDKIGVSVTRAVGFPREDPYTVEQATTLLSDKLADVQESSANVADADRWTRQILHVIAYAPGHADSLEQAWPDVDPDTRADTIVWVTVSDGDDEFLY